MTEKSWEDRAKEIGSSAMASIREMIAALQVDYDRLEELRDERDTCPECGDECRNRSNPDNPFTGCSCGFATDRGWHEANPDEAEKLAELESAAGDCASEDDARQRIDEDPLSLQYRSGWTTPGEDMQPEEFELLLSTGGPAVRIIGELDEHQTPRRPRLQVQDWGTCWTDYYEPGIMAELESYCNCFCFDSGR